MELLCGAHTLALSNRPLVMGVLNVTPDSFSDGGLFDRPDKALEHARRMAEEGADLIDIGAESTRPGAEPVDLEDELARLLPVIEGIAALDLGVPLSVDTAKPEAADRALIAGAGMINDVSGAGEAMLEVAARHGAPVIAMHMRGEPRTMQRAPRYDDVVAEIRDYLAERVEAGRKLGVDVLVDPGIGFGKTLEHNLDLLANLRELRELKTPIVLGVSRKSFLDRLLAGVAVEERLAGTLAVNGWAAALDVVDVLRVHDVREHRQLAESIGALRRHRRAPAPRRRVLARGIPCRCRIGVTARERSTPQDLMVDVEVHMAPAPLGAPDDLGGTTDYAEMAELTQAVARRGEFRLVETLAERIAVAVSATSAVPADGPASRGRIESLRVRVSKPGAARELGVAEVGAEIDWRP
ncbi:MAG: dihydropteroate synthase [Holophagales bacterium]|nr:dihydropteroate synthase [Holophagales bacterium]MYI32946.1 dihydropteroate synthase [Holophagales bacterium]